MSTTLRGPFDDPPDETPVLVVTHDGQPVIGRKIDKNWHVDGLGFVMPNAIKGWVPLAYAPTFTMPKMYQVKIEKAVMGSFAFDCQLMISGTGASGRVVAVGWAANTAQLNEVLIGIYNLDKQHVRTWNIHEYIGEIVLPLGEVFAIQE